MSGVESAARVRRDWVVEWDEPDLEISSESASESDLQDVVRRRLSDRGRPGPSDDRPTVVEPSSPDAWMVGEPLS